MTRTQRKTIQLVLLCVLLSAAGATSAGTAFPGQTPDRRILKTQEKVDSLFEKGKYERALFIYQHELSPLGDKYAQYMVGYMHLAGKGVTEDVITAAAWYQLAAERGQETFVRERDKLLSLLSDEQRASANQFYLQLRGDLGDVALIVRLVDEDLQNLGGRIRANPFPQNALERSNFDRQNSINRQLASRVRTRMSYLEQKLTSGEAPTEREQQQVAELRERVERELNDFENGG